MRTLFIDNYDSYTFNLFQLLAEVNGEEPLVIRNDQLSWQELTSLEFDNLVISPGPGRPENERDFGICYRVLQEATVPILGVCLGHQGLGLVYGGTVTHAPEVVHGRLSAVYHNDSALFEGVPQGFPVVRYHSLMVLDKLPACLEKTAWTKAGVVMGLRHRERPLWGVQFHPESICTEYGRRLIENFRDITRHFYKRKTRRVPRRAEREGTTSFSIVPAEREQPAVADRTEFTVCARKLDMFYDPEQVFFHLFRDEPFAFWLDSSHVEEETSRFSFIGANTGPLSQVIQYEAGSRVLIVTRNGVSERWQESVFDYLDREIARMSCASPEFPFDFNCGFVGYFGYELKAECGAQLVHRPLWPDAMFIFADQLIVFNHYKKETYLVHLTTEGDAGAVDAWFEAMKRRLEALPPQPALASPAPDPGMPPLEFRLHRPYATYIDNIHECKQLLTDGETYEVCLTNQVSTDTKADPLALYRHLRRINPAPYSAFMRFQEVAILSSSPERFLRIDREHWVEAKPIKGTARRGTMRWEDIALRERLRSNEKTRAENLMIVDLLRNDLGLVCEVGSVHVPKLMHVESYATVHQLVSTIRGKLRRDLRVVDCVRAAFPGGSMTGAPKLRTMEIIEELEEQARGIYSGAVGFLGVNGTADLNIAIRTIVSTPSSMSMGVGGAITIQSDPEEEFDEMLLKAQAMVRAIVVDAQGRGGDGRYRITGGRTPADRITVVARRPRVRDKNSAVPRHKVTPFYGEGKDAERRGTR
jgi:para-aminobenzoate synthetase